ncbi:MAG: hypothetical protein K2H82_05160, partial [Oscillospiraceae bacterium]|nr:hypothetical protein [Oscillospiraceae bacterium]
MKKKILVSVLIALMLGIVQPIGTIVRGHDEVSSELNSEQNFEQDSESDQEEHPEYFADVIKINTDGKVILMSDHANEDQVNTLSLSLNLKVRDDVEAQIINASFEFSENLCEFSGDPCEDTYVKAAQYRYDADLNRLTLYLSDTETLFDENGFLYLGYVRTEDIPIEEIEISVTENSLSYVYQHVVTHFEFGTEIETIPETTTTEETTTTTEETTTTTEETTTTTEETTTTTEETTTTTEET